MGRGPAAAGAGARLQHVLPVGDDPGAIERFGQEVAPALREAVASERTCAGTTIGPGARRARAGAAPRRDRLRLCARPLRPRRSSPATRATRRSAPPTCAPARPASCCGPRRRTRCARRWRSPATQDVPLAVRSGGHGISGRSTNDGGIVIDLGALNGVEVLDEATGRCASDRARAGATSRGARAARAGDELGRLRRRRRRRARDRGRRRLPRPQARADDRPRAGRRARARRRHVRPRRRRPALGGPRRRRQLRHRHRVRARRLPGRRRRVLDDGLRRPTPRCSSVGAR